MYLLFDESGDHENGGLELAHGQGKYHDHETRSNESEGGGPSVNKSKTHGGSTEPTCPDQKKNIGQAQQHDQVAQVDDHREYLDEKKRQDKKERDLGSETMMGRGNGGGSVFNLV